jgi:predicted ATP-grasp superfamily ATP-dependent carboligase
MFQWPNCYGPSGGGKLVDNPQIEPILRILGEMTGFHGLCSIDWIEETSTGRCLVIEFNPRATPSFFAGPAAGVDFSQGLRQAGTAESVRQRPRAESNGKLFLMFPESAYYAIDRVQPGVMARAVVRAPIDDPGLLFAILRRMLTHYVFQAWPGAHRWISRHRQVERCKKE